MDRQKNHLNKTFESPSPLLLLPMQPPPKSNHPLCRPGSTACRTLLSHRMGSGTAACDEQGHGSQSPVQSEVKQEEVWYRKFKE